jgi:UDP-N-acetylmuramate dehydrogenase
MSDVLDRAFEIVGSSRGIKARRSFSLAPLTTFRIGGPAAIYVEPESDADLAAVGAAVTQTGLPFVVIGKGSNLLVSDEGFEGVVIRLGRSFRWASRDGDRLKAGGAMPLPALANEALHHGLAGLEFGVAIPATAGGAVRMNAGAHGSSMSDVVARVGVFLLGAARGQSLSTEEAGFAYRRSNLPSDAVVTSVTVELSAAAPDLIRARMEEAREWRRETQPLAEPNCGSVFKNPPAEHAARLVEVAGGKGMRVGGASVSTKHANFIVADPGTRAADVWRLIERIQDLVEESAGVRLETEVHLIGEFEDALG